MRPRGLFRKDTEDGCDKRILINHGLWAGQLDLAASDSMFSMRLLGRSDVPMRWLPPRFDIVPAGMMYPMCGMNVSFSTDILPAMYFTLQGKMFVDGDVHHSKYDRWGDIWCGLFSKVVIDGMGGCVSTGVPRVFHEGASSTRANVDKEFNGHFLHPKLVRHLLQRGIVTPRPSVGFENSAEMYREIADSLPSIPDLTMNEKSYLRLLSEAMKRWTELCQIFTRGS